MESFRKKMTTLNLPEYSKKDIQFGRMIGKGATGKVYNCILRIEDDTIDAIAKGFNSGNYETSTDMYEDVYVKNEIDIGCMVRWTSNYQIQYYGYCLYVNDYEEEELYILMETLSCTGDMYDYLMSSVFWDKLTKDEYDNSDSPYKLPQNGDDGDDGDDELETVEYWDYTLDQTKKIDIMKEMCYALADLHSRKIIHCDLKSNNMLYYTYYNKTIDGKRIIKKRIKLIDFGTAILMGESKSSTSEEDLATPGYMPPEMSEGLLTYKTDIYSLGVSIIEVWCGDIWSTATSSTELRKDVLVALSRIDKDNSEVGKLLRKCVSTDYTKRPTITNLLKKVNELVR